MSEVKAALTLTLCLLFHSPLVQAKPAPDASGGFISACLKAPDCELRFFAELSKTFRPSRKEQALRRYILAVKNTAEKQVWQRKLETLQDAIGNVVIRLPATGKFTGKNSPYLALQAHMDMVLAYANAKPGEDIEKYFKNGVITEIKDGWLQAKGNRTTLGADNGVGVAIELRYLIDQELAHPPLELIFTVQEELGLIGAAHFGIPLLSQKLICLDGMIDTESLVITGSQGGRSEMLHFNAGASPISSSGKDILLRASVADMAGGHSGGSIHRGRMNAIKLGAELLLELGKIAGPVRLRSFQAGEQTRNGPLNKIPNLFELDAIVPAAAKPGLAEQVKSFLHQRIAQNPDDIRLAEINAGLAPVPPGTSASADFTRFFAEQIAAAPNGVIDHDSGYLNSVYTSNNLSTLDLRQAKSGLLSVDLGFMARSFSSQRIREIAAILESLFSNPKYVMNFSAEPRSEFVSWIEPESSSLMKTALGSGSFKNKIYFSAAIEPSVFRQKHPALEAIAIGARISAPHTVNEKLKLDSIPPLLEGLRRIIEAQ